MALVAGTSGHCRDIVGTLSRTQTGQTGHTSLEVSRCPGPASRPGVMGGHAGVDASLPLPLRTCAQARARVLVALDCYGRLPYLVACLRALVAGAWLLQFGALASLRDGKARAGATSPGDGAPVPPSIRRGGVYVR
jgi:hypothetical protein